MYHRDMKIYPAILESTREGVVEKVALVKGRVERVQVDVVDGLFADNVTVGPTDLEKIDWSGLGVDVHLMVDDPMEWVEDCLSLPKVRVIGQIERMGNQGWFVDWVKGYGKEVGLAVDLHTPISSLEKDVLEEVDLVVLLAVKAGFQGQDFDERVWGKIGELQRFFRGEIVVDGGVRKEQLGKLKELGVSAAVGSFWWETGGKLSGFVV